jgi:hypothetical protein
MTGVPDGGAQPGLRETKLPGDDDGGRVGPFPNWTWVYSTVFVYGIVVIGVLLVLTRVLNY